MSLMVFEQVLDSRVGVALALGAQALPTRQRWIVAYAGHYGFEGDPQNHQESFNTLKNAMPRWTQLVSDYRERALLVDRLKAFRKAWVRMPGENYEAVIHEKDGMTAALTSQGPRSRRKRIWVASASAPKVGIEPFSLMLVPSGEARGKLEPDTMRVPLSEMSATVNMAWDRLVETYLASR